MSTARTGLAKELYSAAKSGRAQELVELLGRGADPNQSFDDGFTSLMTAAEAGHAQAVRALAANPRCDLNLRNAYGQNALAFAAQNGRIDAALELLNTSRQNSALNLEALCGKPPQVKDAHNRRCIFVQVHKTDSE